MWLEIHALEKHLITDKIYLKKKRKKGKSDSEILSMELIQLCSLVKLGFKILI
jgi:hypothetical protein